MTQPHFMEYVKFFIGMNNRILAQSLENITVTDIAEQTKLAELNTLIETLKSLRDDLT
jgi:hypothetical protein